MDIDTDIAVHLLEQLIGKGISEVGKYIRENVKREVIIVDDRLFKHYPRKIPLSDKVLGQFLKEMPNIKEDQYYYCKNSRWLVFVVENNGKKMWILLKDIQTDQIVRIIDIIANTRLALKNYLRSEIRIERKLQEEKRKFIEDLFVNKGNYIKFFREKMGIQLDMERFYAVMVVVFENKFTNVAVLKQLSREFAVLTGASPIEPIFWKDMHVVILTDVQQPRNEEENPWPDEKCLENWKGFVEKKLETKAAIGIGNSYLLPDLYKSFNEAHIAITFRLLEKKNVVQHFNNMGIFTELFLHNRRNICNFCRNTLDKLLEYDHDCDSDLQETVRALLSCNFNWKATAEKLFVHVNTLRYRYDKIEQLLNINLADPDIRFNLYAAIRVGDVLKKLDLMQPAYIGNINGHKANKIGKKQSRTVF
jgi:PucR family transcriptional regulator, proline-responsive transcriptional activator